MDPASMAILAGVGSSLLLAVANWLLSRNGRVLAGRKDWREERDSLWKRIEALEAKDQQWEARYNHLQDDYNDVWRKYQALVVEVAAMKLASKEK
jgi:hypothetical protein